jgi:preprotein translocase subunit SecF
MRFFAGGKIYDFMRWRPLAFSASLIMCLGTIALLFLGKARLGTDFQGGTEVELAFRSATTPAEIRSAVEGAGFGRPDVIKVDDGKNPHRYLIRVHEVSTLSDATRRSIERALCYTPNLPESECPEAKRATEVKFSPGGDKVSARFPEAPDLGWVRERMSNVPGVRLRPGSGNPLIQNARDHKVEVQLMSKGDQLVGGLKSALGAKAPDQALRSEWIGPRAGAQLRDSAVKSVLIAIIFIMAYIAFRFDLRFSPGAVIALVHDSLGIIGVLILMGRELDLTTVAAVLTIIGYSVNDTIVAYDRLRENRGRGLLKGRSFALAMNDAVNQTLSRTVLTALTTFFSAAILLAFGGRTLEDFAFVLVVGVITGTYSTIFIAAALVVDWTGYVEGRLRAKKAVVKAGEARKIT